MADDSIPNPEPPTSLKPQAQVPSGRKFIVRFAIGDERGIRSSVWRIWKGKKTDDIYIAPRSMAGVIKASLHATGHSYFSITSQHHARMLTEGTARQKRGITRWNRRAPPADGGFASAFSVLFAAEFLSKNFTPVEDGTSLIGIPYPGEAVIIDLLFGRTPSGSLMLLPNQHELGRIMLSSGEVFLIIAGLVTDFDAEAFQRQHRPFYDTTEVAFSQTIPDADPDDLRGTILLPAIKDEGILRVAEIGPAFLGPIA
jgi:hypothetical protein